MGVLDPKLEKRKAGRSPYGAWWLIGFGVASNHLIAIYVLLYHLHVEPKFYLLCFFFAFWQLMGITAGYHRLWAHHSYQTVLPVRLAWSILTMAAWQGSIKWWVVRHRLHHRYTDTPNDPYDSTRGFWYSHFGWLAERPTFMTKIDRIDMSDLQADIVYRWNTRHYPYGVMFFGFILPTLLGARMGSAVDGFLWLGVMARVISWNGIFMVNSWAHWSGARDFNRAISATGSLLCALVSNGEGNHNFHHEYPKDFRHGYHIFDFDPTKWLLMLLEKTGLVWNLHRTDAHLVLQSELKQTLLTTKEAFDKSQDNFAQHMNTAPASIKAPNTASLPLISFKDFKTKAKDIGVASGPLVVLDGFVLNLCTFTAAHPGGKKILTTYHGSDATKVFYDGKNAHTPASVMLSHRFRIYRLQDHGSGESATEGTPSTTAPGPTTALPHRIM